MGKTVFISAQLPYDLGLPLSAGASLAAYCAKGMSEDPRHAENGVAGYNPNLPSAISMLFEEVNAFQGRLPVMIPELGNDGQMTGRIKFQRGHKI